MTNSTVRFATWNVGGGILGPSHQRNAAPDLGHHAEVLRSHRPDLVCLQEVHEYDDGPSQTSELAALAGYPYSAAFSLSPSHLADGAALALGVLSRFPLYDLRFRRIAAPRLTARRPNGDVWVLHDKGYVLGRIEVPDRTAVHFANGHFFPLHHFGRSATDAEFSPIWRALSIDLLSLDAAGPALAGFDFNYPSLDQILGTALAPGRFTAALPPQVRTTPHGLSSDFLLCGRHTQVESATVVRTSGDHFYCQVDVAIVDNPNP